MTYTPKEWETGDVITATDLNNIEEGVETSISKIVFVSATLDTGEGGTSVTLTKTVKEIAELVSTSLVVISLEPTTGTQNRYIVESVTNDSDTHTVQAGTFTFEASTEDDYPVELVPSNP